MPVRAESSTSLKENFITSDGISNVGTDPDSTKPKYDINDPRNPDCPCHKAQNQADEEYQKQQLGNQQNSINHNPVNNNSESNSDNRNNVAVNNNPDQETNSNKQDVNTNKTTYSGGSSGSQKHYSAAYKFQKKTIRWFKKVNRKLTKKQNGVKKGKIHIADCFHFN